jgi:hypothetical protein
MPSQGQENYVPNPTLDVPNQGEPGVPPGSNPEHWHKGYWLESSWAKYDYKYAGHSGLCVGITILYNGSLNAKWYFDLWPIDDDQVCELTDWYESTVTTQVFVAFGMVNGTALAFGLVTVLRRRLRAQRSQELYHLPPNQPRRPVVDR